MGACFSCQIKTQSIDGFRVGDLRVGVPDSGQREIEGDSETTYGDDGARIRLKGSSKFTSMYSQRGRKGNNQDAMTVWEVVSHLLSLPKLYSMCSYVQKCCCLASNSFN